VNRTFLVQSEAISFDRSALSISESVVVAAGSVNSGDQSRDEKMNCSVPGKRSLFHLH
jgi:hypothetical protein